MEPHSAATNGEGRNGHINGGSYVNGAGTSSNGATENTMRNDLDTDFLIVGCGPAGASLACFLSSYGK